jgi:hypothetical protein
VIAIDDILQRSIQRVDRLQTTRGRTDAGVMELLKQLQQERADFEAWRDVAERLTVANRIVDMRKCLAGVRREKTHQAGWLAEMLNHQAHLVATIANSKSAVQVAEALTNATRILQRRQVSLSASPRHRLTAFVVFFLAAGA